MSNDLTMPPHTSATAAFAVSLIPGVAMSEVLVQFDEPQFATDGRAFTPQVRGRRMPDGIWEAWIEFHPADGSEPVMTRRETEQLTRGDLRYWAAGLTHAYLRGALARALAPRQTHPPVGLSLPDIPELRELFAVLDDDRAVCTLAPALDPVAIYTASGEHALRQALRALGARDLRTIIAAYAIPEMDVHDLARTFEDALAERIVVAMQQRVGAMIPERTAELRGATK